jgi:hypothetical protein
LQTVARNLVRDWQLRKEGATFTPEADEALTADISSPDVLMPGLDAIEADRPDELNAGARMGSQWIARLGA